MIERHTNHPRGEAGVRFAQILRELDASEGWALDDLQRARYCGQLATLHPAGGADAALRRIALNYHLDHGLVEALADHGHALHLAAWRSWMPQALAVLRHAGLDWAGDGAGDLDDLAQVACLELACSLADYRYESRFSSWAFQVIVRSVRNELRGRRAQKRAGQTTYLDGSGAHELAAAEAEQPDSVAAAHLLSALAASVLAAQPDKRLATIFQLWACEDRRVAEIGAHVGLSQARVRVLQKQIVELLRRDHAIRTWLADEGHWSLDG
jgi:RNA polymerase sigma factor (sigma-70 family)